MQFYFLSSFNPDKLEFNSNSLIIVNIILNQNYHISFLKAGWKKAKKWLWKRELFISIVKIQNLSYFSIISFAIILKFKIRPGLRFLCFINQVFNKKQNYIFICFIHQIAQNTKITQIVKKGNTDLCRFNFFNSVKWIINIFI